MHELGGVEVDDRAGSLLERPSRLQRFQVADTLDLAALASMTFLIIRK